MRGRSAKEAATFCELAGTAAVIAGGILVAFHRTDMFLMVRCTDAGAVLLLLGLILTLWLGPQFFAFYWGSRRESTATDAAEQRIAKLRRAMRSIGRELDSNYATLTKARREARYWRWAFIGLRRGSWRKNRDFLNDQTPFGKLYGVLENAYLRVDDLIATLRLRLRARNVRREDRLDKAIGDIREARRQLSAAFSQLGSPLPPVWNEQGDSAGDFLDRAWWAYSVAADQTPALLTRPITAESVRSWIDSTGSGLAQSLNRSTSDRVRVSVWLDDPHLPDFQLLGRSQETFGPSSRTTLAKSGTIVAEAFHNRKGYYYCTDTTDKKFKPLDSSPPPYRSIYALAMGKPKWGVLAVDCATPQALDEPSLVAVARFAELVDQVVSACYRVLVRTETDLGDEASTETRPLQVASAGQAADPPIVQSEAGR